MRAQCWAGHVPNFSEKGSAAAATKPVKDVKAVVEPIKIRLPGDVGISDDKIAARVAALWPRMFMYP